MSDLDVPIEFKRMARNVAADVLDYASSLDDLVSICLIGVDNNQADIVRPYLERLLAEQKTSAQWSEFWSAMPSGIYMSNGDGVRKFLEAVLSRLEKEPYLTGRVL